MVRGRIRVSDRVLSLIIMKEIYKDENIAKVYGFTGERLTFNYRRYFKFTNKNSGLDLQVKVKYKNLEDEKVTAQRIFEKLKELVSCQFNLSIDSIEFLK